ncbi:MAG TPA: peptidoglycan DD-metalloendopeptidase family protein [Lunatimonas sp.]|nr:peptidoglycan DD-metalloendopeptidase family protein [Lunatimonas sp.]
MTEILTDMPIFPVMGEELGAHNAIAIDLSKDNEALNQVNLADSQHFCSYVDSLRDNQGKKYALGGYLENRVIYTRSHVFATDSAIFRNIHLGVDIWASAGTTVFCPVDGVIHSCQDNAGFGNYGPTVILEHVLRGNKIYSLYGHLATADLGLFYPGKQIRAGEILGHLGEEKENGNWPAHLHFQLIQDLEGLTGDYPGVCMDSEIGHYTQNCPNPNGWLNCELLQPIY